MSLIETDCSCPPLYHGNILSWDTTNKLKDHEVMLQQVLIELQTNRDETRAMRAESEAVRSRAIQLETTKVQLETQVTHTSVELEAFRKKAAELERALEDEKRERRIEKEDSARRLRDETDDLRRRQRDEVENLHKAHREKMDMLERKLRHEVMEEKSNRTREVQELKSQAIMEKQRLEMQMDGSGREARSLKMELDARNADLEREKKLSNDLRDKISEQETNSLTMESSTRALKARIEELENKGQSQMQDYNALERKLQEALEKNELVEEKLRNEEIIRRKLHNQVQELKGNIRVFCRVRPTLPHESDNAADIKFPDAAMEGKEIEVVGAPEKTAMGNAPPKLHPFAFDKVFGPKDQNAQIFEEISQLVQSALDGYNVCIFCYGQTGSGKTFTMTSADGMIPRAVHQIYETAKGLEEKGWKYTMEGNFVEVYNENINDLLGKADDIDKKKHEIRHDPKEGKTTITDVETVILDTPSQVDTILSRASKTRSVAATKANERSSRSHSVFILKLIGVNSVTGQRSEGTLNLVDLAGSERLSHSQSTGERLKETQSINRSLSCLGDVIAALGSGKEGAHIPYRNSKLTYLLQYSLGGNSKCLMFVMVSPMVAHLSESLTSLKFATKVNNTTIGTAKKVIKSS
ncbi:P-loop containing nucleoside triphosphate hydrolase protein [Geopyxis carbonaria]|nr:P-loop containing nucleoside triphosphate hydrolase protein [Geopyxis carbonaria]